VTPIICDLRIQPREPAQYNLKQTLSMDLCLLSLFLEETNAGLQGIVIYCDVKASLYTNSGVFMPGGTHQRFWFLPGAYKQVLASFFHLCKRNNKLMHTMIN